MAGSPEAAPLDATASWRIGRRPLRTSRDTGGLARPTFSARRNHGCAQALPPVQVEDHAQGARRGSPRRPGEQMRVAGSAAAFARRPRDPTPFIQPPIRRCRKRDPCPSRHGADALWPAAKRHFHGQQNAHRRHPSGGDPGGGAARQSGRGVRLRVGEPPATARQYLSRQGHAGRAFAAGRLRRLRRQSPRLPGVLAKSIPTTIRSRSPTGRR